MLPRVGSEVSTVTGHVAEDLRLHRRVAFKVLEPEPADTVGLNSSVYPERDNVATAPLRRHQMDVPNWWMKGDWFDACSCNIPCPCGFAQPPTDDHCQGVMAYHVREGKYGDVRLDGLNVIAIVDFEGNAWSGEIPVSLGMFIDERATDSQRQALQKVFSGEAGGWMAEFAELVGEVRGIEYVPIDLEVADDLARWRVEIPGKVRASAEALSGPTTPPGERVQLHNAPGSETGPGQVMTWGEAVQNEVEAFGVQGSWEGQSSKHIPFDWTGPGFD